MNKNPLLIKNFLSGKIPFMKGKTLSLYSKYLSENKFSKVLESNPKYSETLSAYRVGATYPTDFVFDGVKVTPTVFFSEDEWIALGMLLRAYKEVEGVSLLHLYNCLYNSSKNTVQGHVVTGRVYSLYSSTQFPIKVYLGDSTQPWKILPSISQHHPTILEIPESLVQTVEGESVESLVKITLEFLGDTYQPSAMFEGRYSGISLNTISDPYKEVRLIPEFVKIGEYSTKLIEFFSGTLITKLSNPKLISSVNNSLKAKGRTFEEKVINATPGFYNKDGYMDRRIDV